MLTRYHDTPAGRPIRFTRTWWPSHGYSVTGWDERNRIAAIVSVVGPSRPYGYLHRRWAAAAVRPHEMDECLAECARVRDLDAARVARVVERRRKKQALRKARQARWLAARAAARDQAEGRR